MIGLPYPDDLHGKLITYPRFSGFLELAGGSIYCTVLVLNGFALNNADTDTPLNNIIAEIIHWPQPFSEVDFEFLIESCTQQRSYSSICSSVRDVHDSPLGGVGEPLGFVACREYWQSWPAILTE